ncbi:hypothetical protein HFD88_010417 [Aspergillus terreus]|nr:hypothetical protein HFD88_010417 [Aspergillus terreus]
MSNSRPLKFQGDELHKTLDKYLSELSSLPIQTLAYQVNGWKPLYAFREIYRIWRDIIVETFDFPDGFKPRFEESPDSIRILAVDPNKVPPDDIGFIEYHKKTERVVLFNADPPSHPRPVPPQHENTRPGKYGLVGIHKKSINRAVIIMTLMGYRINIETKYSVWEFFKRPGSEYLSCSVTETDKHLEGRGAGKENTDGETSLSLRTCLSVSLRPREARPTIFMTIFMTWLSVVFDIQGLSDASRLCETPAGDIMLDAELTGKLYVDGLLVRRAYHPKGTFRYRYNLRQVQVGSGDGRVPDIPGVDKRIAAIWKEAIHQREDTFLPKYVEILSETPHYLDVLHADKHVDSATAKKIWHFLRSGVDKEKFFYRGREEKDVKSLIQSFGKEPKVISQVLWNILRNASLIRTPEEEQLELLKEFRAAPSTVRLESVFSKSVRHLLEASFKLDKETENIKVMFVDCGENPISVDYENDLLNINSKWLDYNVIHEDYPCRISSSKDNEPGDYFYCDHIVEQLYEQSLQQICKVMSTSPIQTRWRKMSRTLHEKLEEMPRRVIAQKTSSPNGGTVVVSWELELSGRVLSRLGEEIEYCVILHDHGCALESSEIIFRGSQSLADICKTCADGSVEEIPGSHTGVCGCQMRLVTPAASSCSATFLVPVSSTSYYPKVARNDPVAIYVPAAETVELHNPYETGQSKESPNEKNACGHGDEHIPWACHVDIKYERQWEAWEAVEFPTLFRSFSFEEYNPKFQVRSLMALDNSRLRDRFEIDDFLRVSMPLDTGVQYILHIHSIFPPNPSQPGDEGTLLATRYSYRCETPWFGGDGYPGIVNRNEVILHFKDFTSMGSRHDASLVPIEMISKVWSAELRHTVDVPDDLDANGLYYHYCRFAPEVLDLTPGVLGLAEGFYQAQCNVHSGFNFDPSAHLTWRSAYNVATTYDGTMKGIVEDINSQKLLGFDDLSRGTPLIATLSIPDKGIARRKEQITEDIEILLNIDGLLSLSPRPGFLVVACPIWILHKDAHGHFCHAIHSLLRHRYGAHIKKVNFRSHGIPRDETMLVLIASSVCSPVPWTETFDQDVRTSALEKVKDLSFTNPRTESSFNCKHPSAEADVYNHSTGLRTSHPEPQPLGDAIDMTNMHRTVHPDRGDLLSVRELARIQGFDDKFVFLGCIHRQYEDVMNAFPPPIAKKVAEMVLMLIRDYHCSEGPPEENEVGSRGKKRRHE